jgi:hypothetical protein
VSAPALTLECPLDGLARAIITCTTAVPTELHALIVEISRSWVDMAIGVSSGDGDVSLSAFGKTKLRLDPGQHVLQFTPGATTFYVTAERSREGVCAVASMTFAGPSGENETQDLLLETPYDEDALASLRSAQSRDVRWFWHNDYPPRALVRHANNSWGLIYWQSHDGPFLAAGDDRITFTPGALRGTDVPLEASEDIFNDDHLGALWRLTHAGQYVEATISAEDSWTDAIRVASVGQGREFHFIVTRSGFSGVVTLQRSVGSESDWVDVKTFTIGDKDEDFDDNFDNVLIFYRIGIKAGNYTSGSVFVSLDYPGGETTGVARIVSVTDAQTVTVDVLSRFGDISATRYWAEGAWSVAQGFPGAGDLYDGRLWLGAALSLWASKPDDFASFDVGEGNDGDAISRDLATGDASPIRWIMGAFRLQVGVSAAAANVEPVRISEATAMQVRSTAFDEPITPTNMTMRDTSAKIAYVDATGRKIWLLAYDVETGSTVSDLNRLHEDAAGETEGQFVDLCFQARERPRLWAPRADGEMACLTLSEREEVVGWSRYVIGRASLRVAEIEAALAEEGANEDDWVGELAAKVESACAVPGVVSGETHQDYVHFVAARALNGHDVRVHERIEGERWKASADAWHVELGLKYEGPPARYITGLDHLFGEPVIVWGDGSARGEFTPDLMSDVAPDEGFDEGEIGIDLGEGNEVETAIIGLAMKTRYMSGKLPYGAQAGSAVGEEKSLDHVTVLFYRTALGGVLYGVADGNDPGGAAVWFDETKLYRVADMVPSLTAMDDAARLFTGELKLPLEPSNMTDPRIVFVFDGAGPAAILGYVVNLVTNESP